MALLKLTMMTIFTINMCRWTTKFITGFCITGCRMVKIKQRHTADCPCCGHPNKDTSHILQHPHPDAQLLWDMAILQLREHLCNIETEPGMIKDLSAGINAWRKQEPQPPAITLAGQAQASLKAEPGTWLSWKRMEDSASNLLQPSAQHSLSD